VVVDYPPGVSNPPHHHTGSAFVTAYVLQGAVRSQVDDGPVNVYHAGDCCMESWLPSPAQRKRQQDRPGQVVRDLCARHRQHADNDAGK
jgi:redox-sensitive bicupin YhaK (pirin superfamily)